MSSKRYRATFLAIAWAVGIVCGMVLTRMFSAHAPGDTLGARSAMPHAKDAHSVRAQVRSARAAAGDASAVAPARGVLVLYSFFEGDEVSWGNLLFFVHNAVHDSDGAQYVIILNGMHDLADARLPHLPRNAYYALHKNECYDWGTYAWALQNEVDTRRYTYFIFINSSVRGPLLPWYAQREHWTALFTRKLTDTVKLVGPAISCEHFCVPIVEADGKARRHCRSNAHVQSVAVATDQVGLAALQDAGYVLQCHESRDHAVYYGEIGASLAVLQAGYAIDSFLTRYQGVEWRDEGTWQCNAAVSPIGKRTLDGVTASPYEVVFPKLKGSLLQSGLPAHFEVAQISHWLGTPAAERNVTQNWFMGPEGAQSRAEDMVIAQRKGIDCFDWEYYATKNRDVQHLPRAAQWAHFLKRGAVEFREHRWKCGLDVGAISASSK